MPIILFKLILWTGILSLGFCASDVSFEYSESPSNDEYDTPKNLEDTIKELVEQLKEQGFTEEELLSRVQREANERANPKNYAEDIKETCGEGDLQRCRREFKPIPGHVCENIEPIEPIGPFCNCPSCSETHKVKKEVGETNFDKIENMKSEKLKLKPSVSVYHEKWKPDKLNAAVSEEKNDFEFLSPIEDELPNRNLFSCQKVEPVYDAGKTVSGDPDFVEQLKAMTEEEEQPSLGIFKYHEKRSREDGEL